MIFIIVCIIWNNKSVFDDQSNVVVTTIKSFGLTTMKSEFVIFNPEIRQ